VHLINSFDGTDDDDNNMGGNSLYSMNSISSKSTATLMREDIGGMRLPSLKKVRRPSERSERGRSNTRRAPLGPFEHPVGATTK